MRRTLQIIPLVLLVLVSCAPDETIRFGAVVPLGGVGEIYGQAVQVKPFLP